MQRICSLQYAYDETLITENLEDLKTLIKKVKEQSEKGLQLHMETTEVMTTEMLSDLNEYKWEGY